MSTTWIRTALVGMASLMLTGMTACAGDTTSQQSDASDTATSDTVTVFAAASLTDAFTTLGRDFEAAHPGTRVSFSFAGSSALAAQINQGAPADVFASAASQNMKAVTDAGNGDGDATTFARNQLVIAVTKGNPKGIKNLADLTRSDVKVALCAEQVPCGAAAKKAVGSAGVRLTPVTLEQDVRGALSKVKLGEVDAALVYRTDAEAATAEIDGMEFPESAGAVNDYPIVVLKNAPNKTGARAFVAYVLSDKGKAVLSEAGFQTP